MKRIFYITYAALIIVIITFPVAMGQDNKSEQKVKIVVNDGSETKVVIDTVFYNSPKTDSIKLKDGTVIYMKHEGDERDFKHHPGRNHIVVTASSDGRSENNEIIYVNKGKNPADKKIEKTFDVFVSDNEGDTETEKSRYIIARDGMVVTIEGNDDAKAKELAKEIEEKLGVKNDATEKKETVKVESKKAIKK